MTLQKSDSASDRPEPRLPVRVTLAEESELVAAGLSTLLEPFDEVTLVPPSPGGGLATFVDLTLHDSFARVPVSEAKMGKLASRPAGGRLVVYTWNLQQELVNVALAHGASGCLSKLLPAEELVEALLRIAAGETVVRSVATERSPELERASLTPREAEVIGLIAAGLSNHDIARATSLSINSVKSYIRGAYRKIQASTRSQAVLWAVRNGCVTEPSTTTWPTGETAELVGVG